MNKKMLPLLILRILEEYTDTTHALRQADIQQLLWERWELECERKAVARNIELLRQTGYEISHDRSGYALLERPFDHTQTHILMDMVLTSSYISPKDTCELLEKLLLQQSTYFRQQHKHTQWAKYFPHTHNPQLFYTLELIMEAIDHRQKVSFQYSRYDIHKVLQPVQEQKFIKSPWQILLKKGEYYLICDIQEEDGVDCFRLEFISELEVLEEPSDWCDVDILAYYNEHVYMMQGKSVSVTLKVATWIIEQMFDWLGFDITIEKLDENFSLVRTTANLESMVFFSMQYMLSVEVLEPPILRELVADFIQIGIQKYSGAPGSYHGKLQYEVNRKMRKYMQEGYKLPKKME